MPDKNLALKNFPLSGLLQALSLDPATAQALQAASQGDLGFDMVAPVGYRPALIAQIARARQVAHTGPHPCPPLVVVSATGREADTLAQEIGAYIPDVAVFPAWETLPHERLSPSSRTMAARIAVANRLTNPKAGHLQAGPVAVVVTPSRAFLQPVVSDLGTRSAVDIRIGEDYPLEHLVKSLVDLGYQRTDLVENRGQIAVRGGIVDVYPANATGPTRVEFFGDTVEDIRAFTVTDQRTTSQGMSGLWVPACKEVLLTEQVRERAAKLVDDMPGMSEILQLASEGIYAPGLESMASVLSEKMIPFHELLPANSLVLTLDPQRIKTRVASLIETTSEFFQSAWSVAASGGNVPVHHDSLPFITFEDAEKNLRKQGLGWWEVSSLPTGADTQVVTDVRDIEYLRGEHEKLRDELRAAMSSGWKAIVAAEGPGSAERITANLQEDSIATRIREALDKELPAGVVTVLPAPASQGFSVPSSEIIFLTEAELMGRSRVGGTRDMRKMPARRRNQVDPLALKAGDYVVHTHHGIGRFIRLDKRTTGKAPNQVSREYVVLEYAPSKRGAPNDQLWIPTDSLDQLSRHAGGEAPSLSKMGGADWEKAKNRARAATKEIAAELIRIYAAREATAGHAFGRDTPWQAQLEDAFPYVETPDQLATIEEVKADMEKTMPMDRLICGDVGYGKTEIAVRAAFKAVQDGKQVAVLVPTTLLVQQHLETFSERYSAFPVEVAGISRFSTKKEAEDVKAKLLSGQVDVVIGTHALLTGSVRFKDLGLVVIDEEQRFGVEHKEALKALRTNVDVLAMSATPIPRTLEMAVTGIRQMSTLATPPEDRQPVLTYVGAHTDAQVKAAIKREMLRDGQVFFVHNRVESIDKAAARVSELVPEARVRVAHGKMSEQLLEQTIIDFWNHDFDVLVCTTIIETGLDISNANTLIVDRADRFGLSQLHQLRGRVGRGRERAYAYFLYPGGDTMTETAHERLRTIASHTDLGVGVAVAQKDLEIRGAGNLLGGEQSGHIAGVGFDLYVRMVAEAVARFKGEDVEVEEDISIELPVDAYVPEDYVEGERLRLEMYTRIASCTSEKELVGLHDEFVDRYGTPPEPVERLFDLTRLRHQARKAGVKDITLVRQKYVRFSPVELKDSQQMRLKRLHPASVVKLATREVLIPAPVITKGLAQDLVVDKELLDWTSDVISTIVVPFTSPTSTP
ncbi:MAG: transcription-repair coupling factor [Actinomycetaceae bacterium]|nr:transcription-repair coupling factor [Actinomycetaceae bacterium]